jgi:hypothetical protein
MTLTGVNGIASSNVFDSKVNYRSEDAQAALGR